MPDAPKQPTYRAPRLFVEGAIGRGAAVALTPEQSRYLTNVMRRPAGAPVIAFNGRDGAWLTHVEPIGKKSACLVPECQIAPPLSAEEIAGQPWLVFAIVKRQATELIVEKATELGVGRILPVRSVRSNTDRIKEDRLRRIAIEAAEQSERLDVPTIAPLTPLANLLAEWPSDRALIVGDETGQAPPAWAALKAFEAGPGRPFAFFVGPEGGFASDELDAMRELDFVVPVGLGPRVLRAETAAIVGLSLAQAALGDFSAARKATL